MTRAMEHCDDMVMEHCDDKNSGGESSSGGDKNLQASVNEANGSLDKMGKCG